MHDFKNSSYKVIGTYFVVQKEKFSFIKKLTTIIINRYYLLLHLKSSTVEQMEETTSF